MCHHVLSACIAALSIAVIVAGWLAAAATHDETSASQAVRERFAVSFCYGQYKNQTDIAVCLLREARP